MRKYIIVPILIGLASAACNLVNDIPPTAHGLALSTDRSVYLPGDTIRLVLKNNSNRNVGVNICITERVTRFGEAVERPDQVDCTADLPALLPAQALTFERPVPASWVPGEYRISVGAETGSGQYEVIYTPPFVVQGKLSAQ